MRWMVLKGPIRRMIGDAVSNCCADSVEMQSGPKGSRLGPVRRKANLATAVGGSFRLIFFEILCRWGVQAC